MTSSLVPPTEERNQPMAEGTTQPLKYSDVVMKGGITSGVVYPGVVCELAKSYQFKNIGGTSAGAIAAAATAAAELGRSKGLKSFKELETLPQWFGTTEGDDKKSNLVKRLQQYLRKAIGLHQVSGSNRSNLFALFQPQAKTQPLFDTISALLGEDKGKYGRLSRAALWNFKVAALLGSLPGLLLGIAILTQAGSWLLTLWGGLCALLLLVIGVVLAVVYSALRSAERDIPDNKYGLCTGFAAPKAGQSPALTVWLAELLNRLAGLPDATKPLTFGDLWGTNDPTAERQINLAMITTNLSEGRPYRLPFDTDIFFFDPVEFKEFFPATVVDWMAGHARRPTREDDPEQNGRKLLPFPSAVDLPVVVATRMSLSFPILLSAVPLYAIERTPKQRFDGQEPALTNETAEPVDLQKDSVQRCWFSDGGIAINFPIHFFDSPIPRWPTFGINLRSLPPGHLLCEKEAENIWMPETNSAGLDRSWTYFEHNPGLGKLVAFLGVILGTARSWSDETQLRVPGYRDRVVHIMLDDQIEGGLNLNMDKTIIARLSERGGHAGAEIASRFANPNPTHAMSWDNHRWVRYRSTMALLEETLHKIQMGLDFSSPGQLTYTELIQRNEDTLPNSYRWERIPQQQFAQDTTDELAKLIHAWRAKDQRFIEGAPNPRPELRIQPRI